jgi:hypothetical protein
VLADDIHDVRLLTYLLDDVLGDAQTGYGLWVLGYGFWVARYRVAQVISHPGGFPLSRE